MIITKEVRTKLKVFERFSNFGRICTWRSGARTSRRQAATPRCGVPWQRPQVVAESPVSSLAPLPVLDILASHGLHVGFYGAYGVPSKNDHFQGLLRVRKILELAE